jgi:hypothetical protein
MATQSPSNKHAILVQDDSTLFESPILPEKSVSLFSPSPEQPSELMAQRLRQSIQTERERFNRQCEQIKAAISAVLQSSQS